MTAIAYEVDANGIATLTWNLADRPVNVLNDETIAAFGQAVDKAVNDDAVKGVIVASAKNDYIVGADLDAFLATADDENEAFKLINRMHAITRKMETGGKPFVAAINGSALGGGYEIALACHHRIAADNPKCRIGLVEVTIGLFPGGGGTQRLPRLIGMANALQLMTEGKRVRVAEAKGMGMVDDVVPANELLAKAKAWLLDGPSCEQPWDAKRFKIPGGGPNTPAGMQIFLAGPAMLRKKTWGNYPAPATILKCVYEGLQVPIDTALRMEARYLAQTLCDPQTKAMIRSLFFSIQNANKLKNRPADVPKAKFSKVGILGAGMMGAGIAHVAAKAGLDVVLIDATQEMAEAGRDYSAKILDKSVAKGRMDGPTRDKLLARITPTTNYMDLDGCDLVIEAVTENRQVKEEVTIKAEAVIDGDAIFASNTSTLPITGLAGASKRAENFIGLHFFSPAEKMPLVEIIVGGKTSQQTIARSLDFVQRIGKTPIVVNDSRGFYTSRVFGTYVAEGLALLKEGVKPALIENAGRLAGMPVGPLALADEVSISLMHHVRTQTQKDLGDAMPDHPSGAVVDHFANDLKRLGKKDGKGFYDYPQDGKKRLWPGLADEYPVRAEQPDVNEVKDRLIFIQGVETARCLEENVVTSAEDADVGSILGWGCVPSRGGVISNIDVIGVRAFVERCDTFAKSCGPRYEVPKLLRDMADKGESFYPA